MKIFEKTKSDNGRRRIYFCGIKIASYTKKENRLSNLTYFDYSFSLVSPHGAGETSLQYYLELIQLPCVYEGNPFTYSYFSNTFESIGIAVTQEHPARDSIQLNLVRPMIILQETLLSFSQVGITFVKTMLCFMRSAMSLLLMRKH